jgi:transcriptional regulator with XRE-family HTH domain
MPHFEHWENWRAAQAYRVQREQVGSQGEVAELLGITRETLNRREKGKAPISGEAILAMHALTTASPARLVALLTPRLHEKGT